MQRGKNLIFITVTLLMLKNSKNQCKKTSQFKTQCKGDISHAFETAKITVFDPTRDYCEGDDGGKLPPISARGGGEFLHLGGFKTFLFGKHYGIFLEQ